MSNIIKAYKFADFTNNDKLIHDYLSTRVNELEGEVDLATRSNRDKTYIDTLKARAVVLSQELDPYIVKLQKDNMRGQVR